MEWYHWVVMLGFLIYYAPKINKLEQTINNWYEEHQESKHFIEYLYKKQLILYDIVDTIDHEESRKALEHKLTVLKRETLDFHYFDYQEWEDQYYKIDYVKWKKEIEELEQSREQKDAFNEFKDMIKRDIQEELNN